MAKNETPASIEVFQMPMRLRSPRTPFAFATQMPPGRATVSQERVGRLKIGSAPQMISRTSSDAFREFVHLVPELKRIVGIKELPCHLGIIHR